MDMLNVGHRKRQSFADSAKLAGKAVDIFAPEQGQDISAAQSERGIASSGARHLPNGRRTVLLHTSLFGSETTHGWHGAC